MAAIGQRLRGIADLKWEIKEVLVSGNHVIVRGEATGTPAGELMGTPTNGKSFKLMSLDLHTIDGGQIARTHHVEDRPGAVPPAYAQWTPLARQLPSSAPPPNG